MICDSSGLRLICGDAKAALDTLPAESAHCIVTSPPYWHLRDYLAEGQLGQEPLHDCAGWATGRACGDCYVCHVVEAMRCARRVLRRDGTLWLNLGDSYAGSGMGGGVKGIEAMERRKARFFGKRPVSPECRLQPKNLAGIPWRVGLALQADGWHLRADIIWSKTNPMPESVKDRPSRSHEYIFLLTKSRRYYYDAAAVRTGSRIVKRRPNKAIEMENGREKNPRHDNTLFRRAVATRGANLRSVWPISPTKNFRDAHYATFPEKLARLCILAGTSAGGCCARCGKPWARLESIWRPECACDQGKEPVPCMVLDPFIGSGTTAKVAREMGRFAVGIDINPANIEMTRQRLQRVTPGLPIG